jgi:ABC-type transport system involved in cytochrome bd biosynthesis fused ATPase/permease subunit
MNYEDKLQVIWALCFIVSGIVFALAFFFTGISGAYAGVMAAVGYIVLYLGLSMAFLIVFSRLKRMSTHLAATLRHRHSEILEIQKELKHKYLKKKIDVDSYRRLTERYESELTEIDVKLKELNRESEE